MRRYRFSHLLTWRIYCPFLIGTCSVPQEDNSSTSPSPSKMGFFDIFKFKGLKGRKSSSRFRSKSHSQLPEQKGVQKSSWVYLSYGGSKSSTWNLSGKSIAVFERERYDQSPSKASMDFGHDIPAPAWSYNLTYTAPRSRPAVLRR